MFEEDHTQADTVGVDATVAPLGQAWPAVVTLAPAALLAACGGGSGGTASTGGTVSAVAVTVVPLTETQASRFLGQATMGATRQSIADVVAQGYDGWLTAQFAMARPTSHWDWMVSQGYNVAGTHTDSGFDATMWRGMISDPDQLRQRVAMALLDFIVVGAYNIGFNWSEFAAAGYIDVLLDNAFGNFRDLLDRITYNPAMSSFLTYYRNAKANPTTGAQPDENYARELMQLFTIGLYKLNMDGTVAGSPPTETYTQADVSGLARVFTGLSFAAVDNASPDFLRPALVMNASINETGTTSFLGTSVSGGGTNAIKVALDTIFAHQNVAPFIARQLIQRLVTSNPSPAYVGRVATVFANNGKSVRGDMQAVIRAILLDDEARNDSALTAQASGKLREPVMRLTGWARAFGVTSPSAAWGIGDTSRTTSRLGQSMGRSPSVFGWFRPGYTPPDTGIASAGLVAPEFQLTDEQTVVAYVNYMATLVQNGTADVKADYTAILAKASDSAALVAEVNLVLAAGQLSASAVTLIKASVDSISASTPAGQQSRVNTAILLTLASPDFLTVR